LTANSNRRHGLKNEGEFVSWLRARGHMAIHLSPSHSAGDVVAWIHGACFIFETKRVRGTRYRFSKNPAQHQALIDLAFRLEGRAQVWYAISFLKPDNSIVTRFCLPGAWDRKSLAIDEGITWEQMGLDDLVQTGA